MSPYRCVAFDVNDVDLIRGARSTGEPAHVAGAIEAAVQGFVRRLLALPRGIPVVDGQPSILVREPGCFFDEYVMLLVLQELANDTGATVRLLKMGAAAPTSRPDSPDVEFADAEDAR